MIVRDFQSVIGREAREQCNAAIGRQPDAVVACVGGGSNAAGMFYPFIDDSSVELVGVEAGGRSDAPGEHAASLGMGSPGVLHGSLSYVLQDSFGQTADVHSCSAGLDYPGVGPEHAFLKDSGRATYVAVTDTDALRGFALLSRLEGIIPALETAHAVAWIADQKGRWTPDQRVLLCVSGRGDKDVSQISQLSTLPE
jgi:tryptophan synthase beta chain